MGVKRVVTLATEEFVKDLVNSTENKILNSNFDELSTTNKTIFGSINEVNDLINKLMVPEYDVTAQMYYGIIDPAEVGTIEYFTDITFEMVSAEGNISTKPGERVSIPIHNVKQGQIVFVAIPVIFDLVAYKDDGLGNSMAFDETVVGANGIDVEFNGQNYLIFGEFSLVSGNRFVSIVKREPIVTGCECPPITESDITDIIDSLE